MHSQNFCSVLLPIRDNSILFYHFFDFFIILDCNKNFEIMIMLPSQLFAVPVPEKTRTYAPISHEEIHNTIIENIESNGFDLQSTSIKSKNGADAVVMYELLDKLADSHNPDIGIRVGFKNSYNRKVSFGFAIGSVVFICTNGMVSGEYMIKKQHRMADLNIYVRELIGQYFTSVRCEHQRNITFMEELKKQRVDKTIASRVIGELFTSNRIVNQSQLRKMTDEIYHSKTFANLTDEKTISGWDLYNHGTEALKSTANVSYFAKHTTYNDYFRGFFGIGD